MSRYREEQAKQHGAWIIPAASDLESMKDFFEDHPDWSPSLDENGVPTGVQTPWMQFPVEGIIDAYGVVPRPNVRITGLDSPCEDGA